MLQHDPRTGRFTGTDRPYWTLDKWDEGTVFPTSTYFYVYRPDCPQALNGGWSKRCHVVWWFTTGKGLREGYQIHHKDKNRLNDVFENLEEMTFEDHRNAHAMVKRFICQNPACGVNFELRGTHAIRDRSGKFCSKDCYWDAGGRGKQFTAHEVTE